MDKRILCLLGVCTFHSFSACLLFFLVLANWCMYFIRFRAMGIHFGGFDFEFLNICKWESISIYKPKFFMSFFMFFYTHRSLSVCSLTLASSLYQFNPYSDYFHFFSFPFFFWNLCRQGWDLKSIYWRQVKEWANFFLLRWNIGFANQ